MTYIRRKIRSINFSFLLAAVIFAGWALVCAWFGWPHSFRGSSAASFGLFTLVAAFFAAFPVIWARLPGKHPVNHELRRWGPIAEISAQLDREMAGAVEALGPFRFTASFLVYDASYEFDLIPYDQIAAVDLESEEGTPGIVVRTRAGRLYHWYSTCGQGRFNPEKVSEKIRAAAQPDHPKPPPAI